MAKVIFKPFASLLLHCLVLLVRGVDEVVLSSPFYERANMCIANAGVSLCIFSIRLFDLKLVPQDLNHIPSWYKFSTIGGKYKVLGTAGFEICTTERPEKQTSDWTGAPGCAMMMYAGFITEESDNS
eukprot:1954768-Rhodomonas_salina.1